MKLYVVATPIGNLSDCSPRAREVFEKATIVIAEDTRVIGKLFTLLKIRNKPKFHSLHARTDLNKVKKFLKTIGEDDEVALVSDAGTPTISDPGAVVVNEFRILYPRALVVPIPGPSAVISALSVSGFPTSHYEFLGFIPHKKGRQSLFSRIKDTKHTIVLYESPHRIMKTLESLVDALGNREIMAGREMTKQFEEYPRGTAKELFEYYLNNTDKQKGEFVIVISPLNHSSITGEARYQKEADFDTIA